MPKYTVQATRLVKEDLLEVDIDADTPEEAEQIALENGEWQENEEMSCTVNVTVQEEE